MSDSCPFVAALIAPILHVITSQDHLAAVAPFAIESKKSLENRFILEYWSFNRHVVHWCFIFNFQETYSR